MTEPQKWVLTKKELVELINRDYTRMKERMEFLEKNGDRDDVLMGLTQDANGVAATAKMIINRHYKDADTTD